MCEEKQHPIIIGGIEGGGAHSVCILLNLQGELLAQVDGASTNLWLVGRDECCNRINALVQDAKKLAGLPQDLTLKSLGLSMSGCEDDTVNEQLKNELISKFPLLSNDYVVCSDTIGSIATASSQGGLVLISGTGSNSYLMNPDGTTARCGGWGYFLGDEGSAFWVSDFAVKIVIDEEDNRRCPPHDTAFVKRTMLEHFEVKDRFGMLEHCYSKFDKKNYAALCAKLAKGAQGGDALCIFLFREAGRRLGEYIAALLPSVNQSLLDAPGGLPIICVGGVWNSWDLLKDGFIEGARTHPGPRKSANPLRSFSLLKLHATLAIGAAFLGADKAQLKLHREYDKYVDVLYSHKYE